MNYVYELIEASKSGDLDKIDYLVKNNVNINYVDASGWNALMYSSIRGFKHIVIYLLQHQACIYIRDNDKWNVLMIASLSYQKEIIDIILDHEYNEFNANLRGLNNNNFKSALINNRDIYGRNILMYACKENNLDFIDFLLKKKIIDINEKDMYGHTSVMFACFRGNINVIKLLLTYNVALNIKNYDGETLLMVASMQGFIDIVQLLLNNGAHINNKDNDGNTALIHAIKGGYINIVELLLNNNSFINDKNVKGMTPLMYACIYAKNYDIVKLLLNKDSKINIQDNDGRNALMYACINNNENIIELLLNNGANIYMKEYIYRESVLVYSVIQRNIHINIVKLLLIYGGNINEVYENRTFMYNFPLINDKKDLLIKWPFYIGIILFKHLRIYHELDAMTLIDLWEYTERK